MESNEYSMDHIAENIEAMRSGQLETHRQKVKVKYQQMEERFITKKRILNRKRIRPKEEDDDAEWNMKVLLEKGKMSFFGAKHMPAPFQQKYSYQKYFIGEGQRRRPVWIKILNVERAKRLIQIRKLMNLNYLASSIPTIKDRTVDERCQWFRKLQKLKEEVSVKAKFPCDRPWVRPPSVPIDGVFVVDPTWEPGVQEISEKELQQKWYPHAMTFSDPQDFSDPLNTRDNLLASFKTPFEAAHKKNVCRVQTIAKFNSINRKLASRNRRLSASNSGTVYDEDFTLPPEQVLRKRIKAIAFSDETHEVIINNRMAEYDPKKRTDNSTSLFKVACTTLRRAIFTHDWALTTKACEMLTQELERDHHRFTSRWGLWNGGLLAFVNIYKNNTEILKNFAELARKTLSANPSRIGIDVVTWLTQKGHFLDGVNLMEALQDKIMKMNIWLKLKYDNPRMNMIKFAAELYVAVREYAKYKSNCHFFATYGLIGGEGGATDLYETGKFVLSLFELLESRAESLENDCTIIVEPIIDLTLSTHGKDVAREKFHEICRKNPNNGVLADLYSQFLLHYFPDDSEEIKKQKAKLAQYNFSVTLSRQKLRRFQFNRLIEKLPTVSSFKQLPKPGFSW